MMEDYFNQEYDRKMKDARPDLGFQVGVTPELTETPRCANDPSCLNIIEKLDNDNKPHPIQGTDPKWRFFWRIGDRPTETKFTELNATPVIPEGFSNWEEVMNRWGYLMMHSVTTVAEMTAIGLGLNASDFVNLTKNGPHLLAPTGSDLNKYKDLGTVFAGFHYDLNFLTIHGKSRYPGLNVWTREGKKISVRVPDGCLLVQAGKQLEWVTGGEIQAGYHEVVVTDATLKSVEQAKATGRPIWRISSTLFFHIASDNIIEPIGPFANEESKKKYPSTYAGDYVSSELEFITLSKKK